VFQITGRLEYKDITTFFWKRKVRVLTNIRDLVRLEAAGNCWDSKDPSANLTSINVLTVQQISPHHKLCVYHIVQVCAQELGWLSACSIVTFESQSFVCM